jgi:flagellar basal body-associated protein FliL
VGGKTDYEARGRSMSILWIVLIVVLVLALLGFFGRRSFF